MVHAKPGGARTHVHTMAGMMGIHYGEKIIDYRHAFRLTGGLTRDIRQSAQLFRRMVFNVLASNQDDHTKNISFCMDNRGNWTLSPAYDLVFSRTMNNAHSMSVNGKVTGHAPADFEILAEEFSITDWRQKVEEITHALGQWPALAAHYGIQKDSRQRIGRVLEKIRARM